MSSILVIGSVHLDILASYSPATDTAIDKPGTVEFAVGGTAYNIAANLSAVRHPLSLYTHLKASSWTLPFLLDAIESLRLKDSCIKLDPLLPESAFVGHFMEENEGALVELQSAVCASGIESAELDLPWIQEVLQRSQLVVLDCNLSTEHLVSIAGIARALHRRVLVSAVSERKAIRAVCAAKELPTPFSLVSMNMAEAQALGLGASTPSANELLRMKELFGAESLVVTGGSNGYWVIDDEDNIMQHRTKISAETINTIGAGDAVLSAIARYFSTRKRVVWDECAIYVEKLVNSVVARATASSS